MTQTEEKLIYNILMICPDELHEEVKLTILELLPQLHVESRKYSTKETIFVNEFLEYIINMAARGLVINKNKLNDIFELYINPDIPFMPYWLF